MASVLGVLVYSVHEGEEWSQVGCMHTLVCSHLISIYDHYQTLNSPLSMVGVPFGGSSIYLFYLIFIGREEGEFFIC